MYYQTNVLTPSAFITKDKKRLKQFGQNVYLNNGEEFEIELFNPSSNTVLSKIKINGNYLSGGGLVIKPGQRVFLERYLDDARKLKFETYEVDGTSNEVLDAISKNGDVVIEFFDEYKPPVWTNNISYFSGTNPVWTNNMNNYLINIGVNTGTPNVYYSSRNSGDCTLGSTTTSSTGPILKCKKFLETGRVEKGGSSNQSFSYTNNPFNSWTVSKSEWKILPNSTKPYESKDLKVYCTECGGKRKKDSHKFCPSCGTEY